MCLQNEMDEHLEEYSGINSNTEIADSDNFGTMPHYRVWTTDTATCT